MKRVLDVAPRLIGRRLRDRMRCSTAALVHGEAVRSGAATKRPRSGVLDVLDQKVVQLRRGGE